MITLRWRGIAIPADPVLEPVTDDDERALATLLLRWRQVCFGRLVILAHGFERGEKVATGGCDLPSLVVPQHMTVAEDIERRDASGQPLDARVPVRAARGENDDVTFEGSKRGSAAAVTGQDLQNSNLYAHANASDRDGSFCSVRSAQDYLVAGAAVQRARAVIRRLRIRIDGTKHTLRENQGPSILE